MARKKKAKSAKKKEAPAPKPVAPKPRAKARGGRRRPPTGVAVISRIKREAKSLGSAGSTREGKEEAKASIDEFATELLSNANAMAKHDGRKRFNKADVELAYKYLTRARIGSN